ncbi:MAG: hypothetical protein WC223_12060 [Bacteroidales bacterium]|jgi:hypothetical protein
MKLYTRIIILAFFLFIAFGSCKVINPAEETPSYIHINKIDLNTNYSTQGDSSNNISDAWVYIDDDAIGAFELPATIPILNEGNHKIEIGPGIKLNGMAGYRSKYPFYESYINSNFKLVKDTIRAIYPSVQYIASAKFAFKEDFENPGTIFEKTSLSDTSIVIEDRGNPTSNNKKCGAIHLVGTDTVFECSTINDYSLPTNNSPVMLEIDYKNDNNFEVGMIANFTTSQQYKESLVTILPSDEWNKIYINLTSFISANNALSYKIYFYSHSSSAKNLYIDNIKLISF